MDVTRFPQGIVTIRETDFTEFGKKYSGKVRDTYTRGDQIILITTDRISAFDHILRQTIPFKGQVLNTLAGFFFERTADVFPNHLLGIPDPNVAVARKCEALPIEFVVRGFLAGHAWRVYASGERNLCGVSLPDGLKENSRLPEPILTPATKAIEGHDEDISRSEIIRRGILSADDMDELEDAAFRLFRRGSEMAVNRGLLLVDTKYEFGKLTTGDYRVIDEIHTPDSSRYFYSETYDELLRKDQPQRQLSKEFVREWLMESGFQGRSGQEPPNLDENFRRSVSLRYIELYEIITGTPFVGDMDPNPVDRIRSNLINYPGVVPSTHSDAPSA